MFKFTKKLEQIEKKIDLIEKQLNKTVQVEKKIQA